MPRPAASPERLRRCIPALLLACAAVATACPGPAAETTNQPTGATGKQDPGQLPQRERVNYPPMVVDYVMASLREPATDQHAALAQTWDAIARLRDGSAYTAQLTEQVVQLGEAPPVELIAAWLAADPDAARQWVAARLAAGKYIYLQAFEAQPALGRQAIAKLSLDKLDTDAANNLLDLYRDWEPLGADDEPVLQRLAASAEPRTSYRAIGYLLALGKASDEQLTALKQALRSHKINELSAAVEACRIAKDERLAAALVEHAALTAPANDGNKGQSQPSSSEKYTAYALTFLPGEQAALLRQRLLTAKDEQVRWQARLGELLHGDPQPWYDGLLESNVDNRAMWLALQPAGVADAKLLLTYEQAAASKTPETRLKTAQQMNRYRGHASDKLVGTVLSTLMKDEVEQVAAEAWRSAALLRVSGFGNSAQQTVDDPKQLPGVRMGAAFYQLRLAEPAEVAR